MGGLYPRLRKLTTCARTGEYRGSGHTGEGPPHSQAAPQEPIPRVWQGHQPEPWKQGVLCL